MSDMKWVTLGFIQGLIVSISKDTDITMKQRRLLLLRSYNTLLMLKKAKHDREVEILHHVLHRIGAELMIYRIRAGSF